MVSYQQFAQKIKSIHPETQNEDDYSLAQRYLQQYPQYAGRVSMDQAGGAVPGQSPDLMGIAGNVAGAILPNTKKTLGPVASGVGDVASGQNPQPLDLPGNKAVAEGRQAFQQGNYPGAVGKALEGAGENVLHSLPAGAELATTYETAKAIPGLAKGLSDLILHPEKVVGALRSKVLSGKVMPAENYNDLTHILEQSPDFKFQSQAVQQAAREQLSTLTGQLTRQPQGFELNDIYQMLSKMEKATGAYKKATDTAQAGELVSHVIRNYMNPTLPKAAQVLNSLWPIAKSLPKIELGAGGLGGLAVIFKKIKEIGQ